MRLPYSKQINAAFDQVTPLVAAGYEVLQTTKNISILLAAIQVLTVLLLGLILLTLLALLISINPDLDRERQTLITPALKNITAAVEWLQQFSRALRIVFWIVVIGMTVGGLAGIWYTARDPTLRIENEEEGAEEDINVPRSFDVDAEKKVDAD